MSRVAYRPGNTIISRFEIVRYDSNWNVIKRLSLFPQNMVFSIYEDLMKPTLYAEFFMRDTANLLQNFPIMGDEYIHVEYKTPGADDPSVYFFAVFSVANVQTMPNQQGQTYTIRCVSHEHLKNTQGLVAKSYNDYVENIVSDILKNNLEADQNGIPLAKKFLFEESKDVVQLTIPKINALAAIDMIKRRAISKGNPGSPYLFFENKDGFNLFTVDWLIKYYRENVRSQTYTFATTPNLSNSNGYDFEQVQFRNIEAYEMVSRGDTFQKLDQGALINVVKTFDLTSKKFNIKVHDINEAQSLPPTTDKSGRTNITSTLMGRFNKTGIESVVPTSIDIGTNISDNMGAKQRLAALFNETTARVLVQGDSGLSVGDVIEVKIPSAEGSTAVKIDEKFVSGNYLISKIRHMLSGDEHKMVMEIIKMGSKQ